jgi:hypothetical protein
MSEARDDQQPSVTILLDLVQDVAGLRGQMERAVDDRREAANERKDIMSEVNKINERLSDFAVTTATVERLEPIVADYQKLRHNVNGGLLVIAGIGAVLFAAIGFVLRDLFVWLKHLLYG